MSLLNKLFISFVFLVAISSKSFADSSLRVAFTHWPPYQIHNNSAITGVVFDVLKELESRMDIKLHMVQLPQKRMLRYFKDGEIDLEPASNPIWRSAYKDLSVYSIPYFQVQHVIIVKEGIEINGDYVSDFKGKTIGTRLGYNYDLTIGEAFNQELIKRKDSKQHDDSLRLLKADRIDGIIVDRLELNYWINELNYNDEKYREAYDIGSSIDVSMRLHKSQSFLLPQLNRHLESLLNEGFIDNTIKKYTNKLEDQRMTRVYEDTLNVE